MEEEKVTRYFTFKHRPGKDKPEADCMERVEKAMKFNYAFMQQEYKVQTSASAVTNNWNSARQIKEGDFLFLRGGDRIHAVGQVITPRKKATKTFSMTDKDLKSGVYTSKNCDDCIDFSDSAVFYSDLSDKDGWGQRIDVDSWKYYSVQGLETTSDENYIDRNVQNVIRELKEEKAKWFIDELKNKFMGEEIKLLEENKNLILTGAPGTGKTYLAKEIMALKLLFGKDSQNLLSEQEKQELEIRRGFVQFHPSYDYTDFVEGLRPVKEGNMLGFKRQDGVFKKFCWKAKNDSERKYVFIIDEINRGEISKIFGELFSSIELNYRGEKGKVRTQYDNLIVEGDSFKDGFYVPENVYIIGTMNDIDRSVESFDFAMRRRFTWVEITAEKSLAMFEGETWKDKAIERMRKLNDAIWNGITKKGILSASFHIGGAYFKNHLSQGSNEEFDDLWRYHLKSLLFEYLRGRPNADEELDILKKAYGYEDK